MAQDLVIFTAINEIDLARDIITDLLEQDLIKSGTIFPDVELMYKWEGTINVDQEIKIMIKTSSDKYDDVEAFIAQKHPYMFPEIVKLEASFGSKKFFRMLESKRVDI